MKGLHVVVDTLQCHDGRRNPKNVRFLGAVVEVTGDAEHGACCATVYPVSDSAFESAHLSVAQHGRPSVGGYSIPWANLRKLEGDAEEQLEERGELGE